MENGIVYVVFNDWIRNPETNEKPYKIGITKYSVNDRYYGLGLKMPGNFETLFAYKINDYKKVEQLIHDILYMYCENGEWYNINQRELDHIKETCELMGGILITNEVEDEIKKENETIIVKNEKETKMELCKENIAMELDQIKIYFEKNNIRMRNPHKSFNWYYILTKPIKGKLTFCIDLKDNNISCHWGNAGDLNYNIKWFNEKKEKIIKLFPELNITIEEGSKNRKFIRMFIKVNKDNWLNNLLEIFNNTKEIMEYK